MLENGSHILKMLGTIVIDEVHLTTDPGRGAIIEMLVSKIRVLQTIQRQKQALASRLICLSATIEPRIEAHYMQWLAVKEPIKAVARPKPIQYFVICKTVIYKVLLRQEQPPEIGAPVEKAPCPVPMDAISRVCYRSVRERRGCLVFCPTRSWCEKLALKFVVDFEVIRQNIDKPSSVKSVNDPDRENAVSPAPFFTPTPSPSPSPQIQDDICDKFRDSSERLLTCLRAGVAYHHSGLSLGERHELENAFRNKQINVLCCTTTLALGVNLPVSRVCLRSISTLDWRTFSQMSGRVGRSEKCLNEVYICVDDTNVQKKRALELISGSSSDCSLAPSQLKGIDLARFMLGLFAIKRTWYQEEIYEMVYFHTLAGVCANDQLLPDTFTGEQNLPKTREIRLRFEESMHACLLFLILSKFLDTATSSAWQNVEWNRGILHSPIYLARFFLNSADMSNLATSFRNEARLFQRYWPKDIFTAETALHDDSTGILGNLYKDDLELIRAGGLRLYLSPLGLGALEAGIPLEDIIDSLCLLNRISYLGQPLTDLACLLGCCVKTDMLQLPRGQLTLPQNSVISNLYFGEEFVESPPGDVRLGSTQDFYNRTVDNSISFLTHSRTCKLRNQFRYYGMIILYEKIYHKLSYGEIVVKYGLQINSLHQLIHSACIYAAGLVKVLRRINRPDLACLFATLQEQLGGRRRRQGDGKRKGVIVDVEDQLTEEDLTKLSEIQDILPSLRGTRGLHLYSHGIHNLRQLRKAIQDGTLVKLISLLFPVGPHFLERSGQIAETIVQDLKMAQSGGTNFEDGAMSDDDLGVIDNSGESVSDESDMDELSEETSTSDSNSDDSLDALMAYSQENEIEGSRESSISEDI